LCAPILAVPTEALPALQSDRERDAIRNPEAVPFLGPGILPSELTHFFGNESSYFSFLFFIVGVSWQDSLPQHGIEPQHAAAVPDHGVVVSLHRVVVIPLCLDEGDRVGLSAPKQFEPVIQ
jgi:hypothetical protein